MGYIKWDVKEVKVVGGMGRVGELTAIVKGSAPFGIYSDLPAIHKDLHNILNSGVCGKISTMHHQPDIKEVIFNSPATIVFWKDGSKTVVKAQNDELFDPEKGLAMAIAKKTMGNKGNYYNEIKKWVDEFYEGKTFGDALVEAANNERSNHAKYAGLRVAHHNLYVVSHDKRSRKSDMIEVMEEAIEYIKKFLDEEDR